MFGHVPKGRRGQRRSNGFKKTDNDCLSSMLSLVNTGPGSFMESEEDRPSDSQISLGRQRSIMATRPRNFRSKGCKLPRGLPKLTVASKLQLKVFRKKRSQRNRVASQFNARILDLQWRRQNPTGTSLADIWERSLTIDAITKLFEELDINKEGLCLPHNRETALILYKRRMKSKRQ
ncbi:DEMETER-like protein 2 [Arabidopsis thaliana]